MAEDRAARGSELGAGPGLSGGAPRASWPAHYLYCIAEADGPLELGSLGVAEGANQVFAVRHGGLAGVVSLAAPVQCRPTRENLLAHELVNESIMRRHTMVPMSFGTIFQSERDVAALLHAAERPLRELLALLRGKSELGVKVRWDRASVLAELEAEDPALRALRCELEGAPRSRAGARVRRYTRTVERALEARARELLFGVYHALRPLAVTARTRRPVGDDMILNAAFLVEHIREEDFDRAVERLIARHGQRLAFSYTGPWPPYSFVNARLELDRHSA